MTDSFGHFASWHTQKGTFLIHWPVTLTTNHQLMMGSWGLQVVPKQNQQQETRIDVEVMVKERPMKTADLQLEWSLAKGESGKPTLVTPLPGKH